MKIVKYPYKGKGKSGFTEMLHQYDAVFLLKLFRALYRIRLIEEAIADRYAQDHMKTPVHLSIGQEAVAVVVSHFLDIKDYVISTHRGHAHYFAKRGNLKREGGVAAGNALQFIVKIRNNAGKRHLHF